MSDKMEMSRNDVINQSKMNQVGGNNRDGRPSPSSTRKGGARHNQLPPECPLTAAVVWRCDAWSQQRRHHRISDRNREAFLGPSIDENFGGADESTTLIVSNLDYGVTECDILELFSEFGPVKRVGVYYDWFDRSLGLADIIFERNSDAMKVSCVSITIWVIQIQSTPTNV